MRIIFVPIHIGTHIALYLYFNAIRIALESENKYLKGGIYVEPHYVDHLFGVCVDRSGIDWRHDPHPGQGLR